MEIDYMTFDYNDFTLEEIEKYRYYDFICDGDGRKITAIMKEEEE